MSVDYTWSDATGEKECGMMDRTYQGPRRRSRSSNSSSSGQCRPSPLSNRDRPVVNVEGVYVPGAFLILLRVVVILPKPRSLPVILQAQFH